MSFWTNELSPESLEPVMYELVSFFRSVETLTKIARAGQFLTKRTTMSTIEARRSVATVGEAKSRLKIRPKVWRLETLKNDSAEIEAWMSIGSRPARKMPCSTPRA